MALTAYVSKGFCHIKTMSIILTFSLHQGCEALWSVGLYVCPQAYCKTRHANFCQIFSVHCYWLWLRPSLVAFWYVMYFCRKVTHQRAKIEIYVVLCLVCGQFTDMTTYLLLQYSIQLLIHAQHSPRVSRCQSPCQNDSCFHTAWKQRTVLPDDITCQVELSAGKLPETCLNLEMSTWSTTCQVTDQLRRNNSAPVMTMWRHWSRSFKSDT